MAGDLYTTCAFETSRGLTRAYSTSFGLASRLFALEMRPHIYNIYGLTRLADEIVDTYQGADREELLDALERETEAACERGYSTNLVVQAFSVTARTFGIGPELTKPFFASMRIDVEPERYRTEDYERYIYGSAAVVGLMCLRVFCQGDEARYGKLREGAAALGRAFQKVNFLRDIKDDYEVLGRYYFPVGSYGGFDDATKDMVVTDIRRDLAVARPAIEKLPRGARLAVRIADRYYDKLLGRLEAARADDLKQRRIRVPDGVKLWLLATAWVREGWAGR